MRQKLDNNFKIDFIGIGVPKAATNWIWYCLGGHPEVCVSEPKELHFFNKNHGFHKPNESWRYKTKGLDWYKQHFNHCRPGQIKGEVDPLYIYEKDALQLIKKHFPKVKIIISLRNPIDRAYSFFWHIKSKYPYYKNLFKNFEQALRKEPEFRERGFYSRYIKNCFEIFPRENVLILIYEDIKKDPLKFIQQVYEFLRVDKTFIPNYLERKKNPSVVRMSKISRFSRQTYKFLRRFKTGKLLIKIFEKIGLRISLVDAFIIKVKKLPKMKSETRDHLRKVYADEIKRLEKILNRDLSFWY